jgi:hypothetical protein
MNDDAFARLVAEDVKNNSSREQKEYLALPENWSRWQRALKALSDNLATQIETITDNENRDLERYRELGDEGIRLIAEATASFDDRRKKIERFRFHVENKFDEVSRLIAVGSSALDERVSMVEFYRRSIEKHRELMEEFELSPTLIDRALWSSLDGKWEFDEIDEDALDDDDEDYL